MEYFAIYPPSAEGLDAESLVFESKVDALKAFKSYKDARLKSFKTRGEALKFSRNGTNPVPSILDSILKSPPPNQPPMRSLEKSNFPAPKSQDLVKFRKEIEQNNVQKVYELICLNPRYLVSSGDTPSILKEGPRYNALHVAAMNKHAKMAKLILQTVEQTEFVERLHGVKNDPNIEVMTQFLMESYLNTPDKSRNETPLHFAAKLGAVEVIEVLISYPLCKMKPNSEGLYPKDIICARAADTPDDVKKAIEGLLNERFFVPVLRSTDSSVPAKIGEAFTPSNMPKFSQDPLSPTMEIKAYAGPMTSEQAQTFRKRWKTPPRLIASGTPGSMNTSFSPKSSLHSSPIRNSPRMSKSLTEVVASTPKHKKKLFGSGDYEDGEDSFLDNVNGDKNGNHKVITNGVLGEHEEDEYKELFDDLLESKMQIEMEKSQKEDTVMFHGYRNPSPILETPVRGKNDSNSNHLNHNFNSSEQRGSSDSMFCNVRSGSSLAMMTYLDESGSMYNSDNVFDSPSFKEKNIRLTDTEKGLEKVGRDLAFEHNVGWKEYWNFLERLVDIRSDEGLNFFEIYLKRREKVKELKEMSPGSDFSPPQKLNESFGLGAVCASLNNMDLNDDNSDKLSRLTKNGLTSPSNTISRMSLLSDFSQRNSLQNSPLMNPYTCFEQICRSYSKRLASLLKGETIQDQHSYEKTLLQEIAGLNSSIDNYKRDTRFKDVNFQKVHARYSFLFVWYLNQNNVEVRYLRTFTPLIRKVHALASQYTTFDASKDIVKSHAVCLSSFISRYIEKCDKIFNPENVNTETACIDAWNGPDIVECACSFEGNLTSSKHRREIRKKLYSESKSTNVAMDVDMWAARSSQAIDEADDDAFLSCSDSETESDEYLTPPQSPTRFDSDDDDMNVFEESLENLEDEKVFALFIEGDEPMKIDVDVFEAMGERFVIDEIKFPLVFKWYNSMKLLKAKSCHASTKNNFRIFTPKLKLRSGVFSS